MRTALMLLGMLSGAVVIVAGARMLSARTPEENVEGQGAMV